jgi:hypothetical protein
VKENTIDQIVGSFVDSLRLQVEETDTTEIEEWQHESAEYQLSDVEGIVGRLGAALHDGHAENIRLHCAEAAAALLKISYIYGEL